MRRRREFLGTLEKFWFVVSLEGLSALPSRGEFYICGGGEKVNIKSLSKVSFLFYSRGIEVF